MAGNIRLAKAAKPAHALEGRTMEYLPPFMSEFARGGDGGGGVPFGVLATLHSFFSGKKPFPIPF